MRGFWALLFVVLPSFSAAKAEEGQAYFPLQVGNTWTYVSGDPLYSTDTVFVAIPGIEQLFGETYFRFKASSSNEYYYERVDENGDVWSYSPGEDEPRRIFRFSAKAWGAGFTEPGDVWWFKVPGTEGFNVWKKAKSHLGRTTPAGHFDDVVMFVSEFVFEPGGDPVPDLDCSFEFARGVGRIYFGCAFDPGWVLNEAYVNGVKYPKTDTNVEGKSWGLIKRLFSP